MDSWKMGMAKLCETCQREQIWQHLVGKQEPGSVKDFPLNDIEMRKNCPFCKLLYRLIALNLKQSDNASLQGKVCQLRTLPGPASGINISFREQSGMRIQVEKTLGKDASNLQFPPIDGSPQMDIVRLRQILTTCLRDHERCRFKLLSDSHCKKINLLLIDVHQYCIVEKAYDCDRVALSYVWGKDQVLKTTRQTLADFKEEGFLLKRQHEIPRTIWNPVLLVREVGQHYLWVSLPLLCNHALRGLCFC
jgi:hypothetical protein